MAIFEAELQKVCCSLPAKLLLRQTLISFWQSKAVGHSD